MYVVTTIKDESGRMHVGGKRLSPVKTLGFSKPPSLTELAAAVEKEFQGIPLERIQVHEDDDTLFVVPLLDEEVGTDEIRVVDDGSKVYLTVVDSAMRNGISFPDADPTMRQLLDAVRRRNKIGHPEDQIKVRTHPVHKLGTVADVSAEVGTRETRMPIVFG